MITATPGIKESCGAARDTIISLIKSEKDQLKSIQENVADCIVVLRGKIELVEQCESKEAVENIICELAQSNPPIGSLSERISMLGSKRKAEDETESC